MQLWRDELESAKLSRQKLKERMNALRRFILLHFALLALSLVENGLSLYIVINYQGPSREWLLLVLCATFLLMLFILFSGLSRGSEKR